MKIGVVKRANIVTKFQKLQKLVKVLPKNSIERKSIGKELHDLGIYLNKTKRSGYRNLTNYIIDVVKEGMTEVQWNSLVEKAKLRKEKAEGKK